MTRKEFIPQASKSETVWNHIDIMVANEDFVYHRYGYVTGNNTEAYGRIVKSAIRYAKPEWSEWSEPYFMRHGRREYLSEYMVIHNHTNERRTNNDIL